jgi:hypothetical protein
MNPFRRSTRDDRDAAEFLDSVRPADWDGTTITFTGASGTGLPGTMQASEEAETGILYLNPGGPRTEPITRYLPAPGMLPALPAGDGTPAEPADRFGRPPRTPRPADAAMYVRTKDGPGLECGLDRWRRHADPAVQDAPYMFDALRESARAAGWRPDAVGRWICPRCQHSPLYWPLRAPRHSTPRVRQAKIGGQYVSPAVEFDFEVITEQASLERLRASRARTAVISRGDGRFLTARIVTGDSGNYQGRRRAGAS